MEKTLIAERVRARGNLWVRADARVILREERLRALVGRAHAALEAHRDAVAAVGAAAPEQHAALTLALAGTARRLRAENRRVERARHELGSLTLILPRTPGAPFYWPYRVTP